MRANLAGTQLRDPGLRTFRCPESPPRSHRRSSGRTGLRHPRSRPLPSAHTRHKRARCSPATPPQYLAARCCFPCKATLLTGPAVERVVAFAAVERVVAHAAEERVVAGGALE